MSNKCDTDSSFSPIETPAGSFIGRPAWAEINLDNLAHNFRVTRNAIGPGVAIMPAVKADAYGHGAVECARTLEAEGAEWFGVSFPEEAIDLRRAGITRPILCLSGFCEGQQSLLLDQQLTPAVYRIDLLDLLDRAAESAGTRIDFHLKIDTGMGRLGVPMTELNGFLEHVADCRNVRLDGVMAHFASADERTLEDFTREQMALFEQAIKMIRERGHSPGWIHESNSAATHAYPESRGNMVRLGGLLYGLWRDVIDTTVPSLDWRPVMSLLARIIMIKTVPPGTRLGYGGTFVTSRETVLAILPIGYEDGLRRRLSNRGKVIIRGQIAPIVGRVSMDLTIVDVSDIGGVSIGDEAILFGSQEGVSITAEEMAAEIETIGYEVTCGISERVPRVYRKSEPQSRW